MNALPKRKRIQQALPRHIIYLGKTTAPILYCFTAASRQLRGSLRFSSILSPKHCGHSIATIVPRSNIVPQSIIVLRSIMACRAEWLELAGETSTSSVARTPHSRNFSSRLKSTDSASTKQINGYLHHGPSADDPVAVVVPHVRGYRNALNYWNHQGEQSCRQILKT